MKQKRNEDSDDSSDSEVESDNDGEEIDMMQGMSAGRLPTKPHPKSLILDDIDFTNLPPNFFALVYGARRTGKTHAVSCLLEGVKDRFDFAYLFSATAGLHKGQKGELDFDMIRDEAKFTGFDQEALQRIMDRQKLVIEHNNKCTHQRDKKPNNTLIIFDDFVHENAVRYSKIFTELPVLGRHYELSVICLSQGYSAVGSSGLNPATRQNADFTMTFLPRNINDVERVATWYLSKPKLESMWFIKSVCQNEHMCLGLDLTHPHLTEFEDYCFQYKAPDDVPKYELGKVQWKLFREERKRQRKATLQDQVQTERTFFSTNSNVEIQSKLNEGTGLPPKRTRISLHQACHHA